ncbi:hypothetical protein [Chamaesiphon sp.]|uniref:hypothetical protein n=1 Tax=Chamaesiphon sp. TaxID=2814140 RepID=UPI0035947A0E
MNQQRTAIPVNTSNAKYWVSEIDTTSDFNDPTSIQSALFADNLHRSLTKCTRSTLHRRSGARIYCSMHHNTETDFSDFKITPTDWLSISSLTDRLLTTTIRSQLLIRK